LPRRRLKISLVLALALAALACAPAAGAAVPAGPRLTFVEAEFPINEGEGASQSEEEVSVVRLVSTDPQGGDSRPLLGSSTVQGIGPAISWIADGSEFAFRGEAAGSRSGKARLYIAAADGSGVHAIAGTKGGSNPVLSPDGSLLAFSRTRVHRPKFSFKHPKSVLEALRHTFSSTTTWIVPTEGGKPQRLTPWRNGSVSTPTSISPDGSTLAVSVSRPGTKQEVDAVELATGKVRTLEVDGFAATYSPDGSEIAFVTYRDHESVMGFDEPEGVSELYVARAEGTGAHRITHTPKMQEGVASWDPSGSRLAYLRSPGGFFGILEGQDVESNADGSCPTAIPVPKARHKSWETFVGSPTWLAGPERGAGPLSC
jgi:Tol biopolymer transport system component